MAAWREALLAQKVLQGATRGYVHHPQLARFRAQTEPVAAVASFLAGLADEAGTRGYHFDGSKIGPERFRGKIAETQGQLLYEWEHLREKLRRRSPEWHGKIRGEKEPEAHPLFRIVPGAVRAWEKR